MRVRRARSRVSCANSLLSLTSEKTGETSFGTITMAQMQPIGGLSMSSLIGLVAAEVRRTFPEETFLDEELSRLVGGVLNALNWGLIRMAREQGFGLTNTTPIDSFETDDYLSTRWMSRDEIVLHGMVTTGLPREVVAAGVHQIENQINISLRAHDYVRVAWLGTVARSVRSDLAYRITLSEELRFPSTA